ncbi:hypothetical protein MKW94_022733 [Papaver nudicaule]|uniref:RING-type domain-containing protein n=1 Tax=Papaver nudicaule TaxID=74823 RepID=A0AA42AZF2_PAPNU|nr:hypothetical protein [Papaver nudicaule]
MTTTDLGSIDDYDEGVILSPTSFAQAIWNRAMTTITAERPPPHDDGLADEASSSRYKMRKKPATSGFQLRSWPTMLLEKKKTNRTDLKLLILQKKRATKPVVTPHAAPPKPPPREPAFNYPVCMRSFVEATSTKCDYIFCKQCINSALSARSKCPACRKKLQ